MNPTANKRFIPLNIIDRSYVISQEKNGSIYFPMCVLAVVRLKNEVSSELVVSALQALERRYPQLRLSYTLDAKRKRWSLVAKDRLPAYLSALVNTAEGELEAYMGSILRENNSTIEQPLSVHLVDSALIVKMHHSFGDGSFLRLLTHLLLLALYDPAQLPDLQMHFNIPITHLLWQTPSQAFKIAVGCVKSFANYYREYQQEMSPAEQEKRDPIVSGSEMRVMLCVVPAESIELLNTLRTTLAVEMQEKISLNTLLQVLIAWRLRELQWVTSPLTYTILVDLHRYLKQPNDVYPGNLASQIRISRHQQSDLAQECAELQRQVNTRLAGFGPLFALPSEALLALNHSWYENINRDWLLNSTDARFFILSNLGNLDDTLGKFRAWIKEDVFLLAPLMGRPPLVISFNTLAGQGNLALTYDPRVLSAEQVQEVCGFYQPEWLAEKLAQYTERVQG